jgi:hypothetical protein
MTVLRRGRRIAIQRSNLSSHRSAAAPLDADLPSALRHKRRTHRRSPVPEAEVSRPDATKTPIRGLPPEQPSHEVLTRHTCPLNLGATIMTQTRARQILQSLIQGLDPVTCEELPRETVLQHSDVLRALLAGLTALEQTAARAQRRAQLPDNVGQAWTTDEEGRLVAAFKSGDSPIAIARQHGRTLRAIEARLEKLGLITAEQRTTRGGFTGIG